MSASVPDAFRLVGRVTLALVTGGVCAERAVASFFGLPVGS